MPERPAPDISDRGMMMVMMTDTQRPPATAPKTAPTIWGPLQVSSFLNPQNNL